jgi:hypothetical protein
MLGKTLFAVGKNYDKEDIGYYVNQHNNNTSELT